MKARAALAALAALVALPPPAFAGGDIRIEEFRRSAVNPNVADPATRRVVLKIAHPTYTNHYGGQLQTGPDGMLYAATGDGGGGGDPDDNAQDTRTLLGKLLRVDPAGSPYSIPAGNPFAGQPPCNPPSGAASCPEVYAYGLRNPFRFSFDRQNGDILIGDVGQQDREEVNHVTAASLAGADFGWDCFEGTTTESGCDPGADYVAPVFEYVNPVSGGAAVTGGYVVRDPALTPLLGRYVYADFYAGDIRSFALSDPDGTDAPTGLSESSIAAFGEDAAARLHVVSLAGAVSRVACAAGGCGNGLALVPAFTGAGLDAPISLTASTGDASRVFVTERGGRVRVAVDGVVQAAPFLDIASMVDTAGEGGLLSIALAADYASSGRFYVYYVAAPGVTDPPPPPDGGDTTPTDPPTDPTPAGDPTSQPAPPAGGAGADTTPPRLAVRVARVQDLLRLRRVRARLRCSERCTLRVTATVRLPAEARTVRLRGVLLRLEAGRTRSVRIAIPRRVARRLRRARRPAVRLGFRARDPAGNLTPASRLVRARR